MILFAWSTCRSGWAASIPSRASATTSFGSLMSFFMTLSLSLVGRSGRGGGSREGHFFRIGEVDPGGNGLLVSGRVGNERVAERGQRAGEELRAEVDRQLLPVHGASGELLDQHRTECAGRVDGGAGGRG